MVNKVEIDRVAYDTMQKELLVEIDRAVKQASGFDPYDTMISHIVGRYLAPVNTDTMQQTTVTLRLKTAKDVLVELQQAQEGSGGYLFIPMIEELRSRINAVENPTAATSLTEMEIQRELRRGAYAAVATRVTQKAGLIIPPEVISDLAKAMFDLESTGINLTAQESRLHR